MQIGNYIAEKLPNNHWKYTPVEKAGTSNVIKGKIKYRDKPEIKALEDFETQYKKMYLNTLGNMTVEIATFLSKL